MELTASLNVKKYSCFLASLMAFNDILEDKEPTG